MSLKDFLLKIVKLSSFFFLGAFVGCIFLGIVFTFILFKTKQAYSDLVYPGVKIFSQSVAGKNKQEIKEFLDLKNLEIRQKRITFIVKPDKKWEITPKQVDLNLDVLKIEQNLLSVGKKDKKLFGFSSFLQMMVALTKINPEFVYDQEKLKKIIDLVSSEVNVPAQEALFDFKEGKVISFRVSSDGLVVDEEKVLSLVINNFTDEDLSKREMVFDLPTQVVTPKIQASETNKLGIVELLGEGGSSFKDSIPSRVSNIRVASSRLHGIVVPPGEIFSFGKEVGDISDKTGYEKAYVIKDNKTLLEDGGGVCQVSTTMFRAVLNAGLPIIERQAHYYRVGFYEQGGFPPGLDATVYPPSPDFKFKNDTENHVLIQSVFDSQKKKLYFLLYGTTDGRKTEISKPVIHSQTPPPADVYTDDPNLPAGVVKRFDVAHWGAKVSFIRKVFNADGSLKEEKTFWSNYNPWPAVYLRGTGPG